jgi:hypothetical protein
MSGWTVSVRSCLTLLVSVTSPADSDVVALQYAGKYCSVSRL